MGEPAQDNAAHAWRVSLRAKGIAALAILLAALFAALFAVYWLEEDVAGADRAVLQALNNRAELVGLQSSLLDAQSAVNAYAATRQPRFLAALESARQAAGASQARLAEEAGDDPQAVERLTRIRAIVASEMEHLDGIRRASAPPLPVEGAPAGNLRAQFALLNTEEEARFTAARERRDRSRRHLFGAVILFGVFGPLGALLTHLSVRGRMARRLRIVESNAYRLAHGLPLEGAPPGSDEVARLGRQVEHAAYVLQEREREIRESERRYRSLFDHAPVPYEETDRSGVIRRFNQAVCALLKCPPQQMAGRHAWDFLDPEEQGPFRAAMVDRIAQGVETEPFECGYVLDDGSRLTLEIRESLIRDESGEVTGAVHSLLDVTQRNMAALAARKAEQYAMELRIRNEQLARALEGARSATVAKSRFLASVSHELRTPLNGVIGFGELLYDGKLGPVSPEQLDVLSDILTSARHLLQLINDVLDLSKVEAGRMEFHPTRHHVRDLIFEVRDVIRPLAEKKKLALRVEAPAEFEALIDGSRFKQILYNYLSNAVKFTANEGVITVRATPGDSGHLYLEVEDTGIGIAEDELPRLFQEFGQLPNSRKAEQGTGLGLALTRYIVEAQGGSVGVRSRLGQGSVFLASLPVETVARSATS